MKLVIEIPNEVVEKESYADYFGCFSRELYEIIKNGTPLPKGHGRLIDADMLDETVLRLNTEQDAQITRTEYKIISNVLYEIPTIIEADKEREE